MQNKKDAYRKAARDYKSAAQAHQQAWEQLNRASNNARTQAEENYKRAIEALTHAEEACRWAGEDCDNLQEPN